MDTEVVQQFIGFFEEYLQLCRSNWPNDRTNELDIKNAFLKAQHIEKCKDKFIKQGIYDEFLNSLSSRNENFNISDNNLTDPTQCILMKIMNSSSIEQLDKCFKVFLELYPEDKLESYLADFMLKAASSKTLLENATMDIPTENLIDFKCVTLLSELNSCEDAREAILPMLTDIDEDNIELLVQCLLNTKPKFHKVVNSIVNAFIETMLKRSSNCKMFWKYLFSQKSFIKMCLAHNDLFKLIIKALLDCGKLIKENMSMEYFYIDMNYTQLSDLFLKICANEGLKKEFFGYIDSEVEFWQNMID